METATLTTLLTPAQIEELLGELAEEIVGDESLSGPIALVGIRSRGEILAQRLAGILAQKGMGGIDVGALDITMYRDDLRSRKAITIPLGTEMDFAIDGRAVVLVDDVLETGRTVRAALDGLVDFGRPGLIRLAVLIDRGRREFPIQADYVGVHIPIEEAGRKIIVRLRPTDPEDGVYLKTSS